MHRLPACLALLVVLGASSYVTATNSTTVSGNATVTVSLNVTSASSMPNSTTDSTNVTTLSPGTTDSSNSTTMMSNNTMSCLNCTTVFYNNTGNATAMPNTTIVSSNVTTTSSGTTDSYNTTMMANVTQNPNMTTMMTNVTYNANMTTMSYNMTGNATTSTNVMIVTGNGTATMSPTTTTDSSSSSSSTTVLVTSTVSSQSSSTEALSSQSSATVPTVTTTTPTTVSATTTPSASSTASTSASSQSTSTTATSTAATSTAATSTAATATAATSTAATSTAASTAAPTTSTNIPTTTTETETTTADPCDSQNCSNAGTCSVVNSVAMCNCSATRTGSSCESYVAFWADWSSYGSCTETCGSTATQTRTRTCTDAAPTSRALTDCDGLGDSVESNVCIGLPECVCTVHPCFDSNGNHTDAPCNPTGGDLHVCYEEPSEDANGNPLCLQRCTCASGYDHGSSNQLGVCFDVDECSMAGAMCFVTNTTTLLPSVSQCQNTAGDYSCICADGYESSDGKTCNDIDECSLGQNGCDSDTRATCVNTAGAYTCQCNSGFSGDGYTCNKNRFLLSDYTVDATQAITDSTTATTEASYIPDGGFVSSADDISVINSMYATRSGLIVFTSYKQGQPITYKPLGKPDANSLSYWSTNKLDGVDKNIVNVAAVYWAENVISSSGGIYTRWIPDLMAVSAELRSLFTAAFADAAWAYVVTWDKMKPSNPDTYDDELNSYQAVVVGDAMKNDIRVGYIYQDRAMNWKVAVHGNPSFGFYPARVGTMFNAKGAAGVAEEYVASGMNPDDYSLVTWLTTEKPKIVHIDRYNQQAEMAAVSESGGFHYNITVQSTGFETSGVICKNWLDSQPASSEWEFKNISEICAGTLSQISAVLPANYFLLDTIAGYDCYQTNNTQFATDNSYSVSPRCCYDSQGALLTTQPSSVALVNGLSLVFRDDDMNQQTVYEACCNQDKLDSGETPQAMCNSYLDYRPPCSSGLFEELAISQIRGDPHITTLDGLSYTFNGHGEFFMVKSTDSSNFVLQGRTARVNTTGDATVFTGFAGRVDSETKVQLSFTADFSDVELFIDNGLTSNNWTTTNTYGDVTVFNDSGAYALSFSNGVVVKVTASFDFELMTVSLIMDPSLRSNIQGLMGNYNGDITDELTYDNGTMLSVNSTESEIYPWGLSWMTDSSDTLFTYPSGENWTTYNDAAFTPVFFDSNLDNMFSNVTKKLAAIRLCNGGQDTDDTPEARRECYFDYKVTDNAAAAEATADAANDLASEKAALANFAPVVNNANATFMVTVGMDYPTLYTIDATDQNGDSIVYSVAVGSPAELSVSASGVVSWTGVQFAANDSVVIIVSDGTANTVFSPQVALCYCQNAGTCKSSDNTASWYVQPCECARGWTGDFCEEDIDGCAENPCFTTCTDVVASKVETQNSEFVCDPCPAGLDGNGQTCYDVNECLTEQPCQHVCVNTAGSFVCSCNSGYALAANGRNCTDIDECLLGQDDCDALATCSNTMGGWTCTCDDGYQGAGATGTCLNVDECSNGDADCPANSNCVDTEGSYSCPCVYGYKANGDSCENIDECALSNLCDQECVDGIASYTCECAANFVLNQTDQVTCVPDNVCTANETLTCDNGNSRSTCAKDQAGNVLCYCPNGFTLDGSKVCQDTDECATGDNICSAATSTCQNSLDGQGYSCVCNSGFQTSSDGVTCEDINECLTNNGGCAGDCGNTAGSFVCSCSSGFNLASDGLGCENINECASDLTNNCDALYGTCTDQTKDNSYPLGYVCSCQTGYQLSSDGFTCTDLNECNTDSRGDCTQGCTNNIGSYTCYCGNGYSLNATTQKTCDNIDECASSNTHNCYSDGLCTDTMGGYTCSCPSGFTLKSDGYTCESIEKCQSGLNCSETCSVVNSTDTCQCPRGYELQSNGLTCADIDECTAGTDVCSAGTNVQCSNSEGGYDCICISDKYTQVESAKCIDVDECAAGTATCPTNSYCQNRDDGYDCTCNPGYVSDVTGSCIDINECLTGADLCNDTLASCTNTDGGYTCACNEGYEGDGITCMDVNECNGDNDCDSRAERGICTNTIGSYSCACATGYVITSSYSCNDIDECSDKATYNVSCSQLCVNRDGSFTCGCQEGYSLDVDGTSCVPQVACTDPSVCDHSCLKRDGVDTCTCNQGYELDTADNRTCNDINECTTNTSTCATVRGVCTNTVGSFSCSCSDGYTLGDGNSCDDRDGGFGDWSNYTACTATCGADGMQTRTRQCDNPTQQGNGADCVGDMSMTSSCNVLLCPDDLEYGVTLQLVNVSAAQFSYASSSFDLSAATAINDHCTYNVSTAQECCNVNATLQSPVNKTFVESGQVSVLALDTDVGSTLTITITFDDSNDVCNATVSRRKRAIANFQQSLLLSIVSSPTVLTGFQTSIQTALTTAGINVVVGTIATPTVAEQITTTAPTTTAPTTTTSAAAPAATTTTTATSTVAAVTEAPPAGVATWVIAVAVVASLVVVAVIVIIVVMLVKKPGKVAATDSADGQQDGSYRQTQQQQA